MKGRSRFFASSISLALAACGSSTPTVGVDAGSTSPVDAGSTSHADAGTNGNGLTINAALGFTINAMPVDQETTLSGLVLVELDGEDVPATAVVTINGKALRVDDITGFFEADPADVPVMGSDRQLTISASASGKSTSITVECPEELTMTTSPVSGSVLAVGATVTASWSRDLFVNPNLGVIFGPTLTLVGYDSASNHTSFDKDTAKLTVGARSGTLKAPDTTKPGYLLTLAFAGVIKLENGNAAVCFRSNRVTFTKE